MTKKSAKRSINKSSQAGARIPVAETSELLVLYRNQHWQKLEMAARKLAVSNPKNQDILNFLGASLIAQKKESEAEAIFQQVLTVNPNNFQAWNNLGTIFSKNSQVEKAIGCFNKSIEIGGASALSAHNNRGEAYIKIEKYEDAAKDLLHVLMLNPNFADAIFNLGWLNEKKQDYVQSISYYSSAINLDKKNTSYYYRRALVRRLKGELDSALDDISIAERLQPNDSQILLEYGLIEAARGNIEDSQKKYQTITAIDQTNIYSRSNWIFQAGYTKRNREDYLNAVKEFGQLVADRRLKRYEDHTPSLSNQKLKIGFISADLYRHPVGYFLLATLRAISKHYFDLIVYDTGAPVDIINIELKSQVGIWRECKELNDENLAELIYDDKINILIDLAGHTGGNRLSVFAYKPSPIQLTWLGYWDSTGVKEIDYILVDSYSVPVGAEDLYTEEVWRLPEIRYCYSVPEEVVEVNPLPLIKNKYITFGCFNNLIKINDEVIITWAKILKSVPESKIFFKTAALRSKIKCDELVKKFEKHGIYKDRLILEAAGDRQAYFKSYHQVDLALDPFPFPGGTISVEGLWMGVPVITLAGTTIIERQGVQILSAIGLTELIASTVEEYVDITISFSRNIQKLEDLRKTLRRRLFESPLMDARSFAISLQEGFTAMWHSHLEKRGLHADNRVYNILEDSKMRESEKKVFLHIGCGPARKEHTTGEFRTDRWNELRLDIDESVSPDIVGTMTDMGLVEDASVDAIYSSHNIEHLYPHEVPLALAEFRRVLRNEGYIVLTCPDMQSVCALVAQDKLMEPAYISAVGPISPIDIMYGHRASMQRGNLYMAHRTGFTESSIRAALQEAGFAMIATKRREAAFDLWILASKSPMPQADMRELALRHFPN